MKLRRFVLDGVRSRGSSSSPAKWEGDRPRSPKHSASRIYFINSNAKVKEDSPPANARADYNAPPKKIIARVK
jgi:hypothetical protein